LPGEDGDGDSDIGNGVGTGTVTMGTGTKLWEWRQNSVTCHSFSNTNPVLNTQHITKKLKN